MQPLQQLLVRPDSLQVFSLLTGGCGSSGHEQCPTDFIGDLLVLAEEPDLDTLSLFNPADVIPSITQNLQEGDLSASHPTVRGVDPDIGPKEDASNSLKQIAQNPNNATLFSIAALASSTSTGAVRQHALQFNSSVTCIEEAYPDPCPGDFSFHAEHTETGPTDSSDAASSSLQVCVPRSSSRSPWTMSRDPITISEDIYIQTSRPESVGASTSHVKCTLGTTRAYFELPSTHNSLDSNVSISSWPSQEVEDKTFNAYVPLGAASPKTSSTLSPDCCMARW